MSAPVSDRSRTWRNSKLRGKQDERDCARIIGGKRHPADVGGGEDIAHPELCVQVKGGSTVSTAPMRDGLAAAQLAALGTGKLPCVILVDRRGTRNKRYIVFGLEQYCDWNGFGAVEVMEE